VVADRLKDEDADTSAGESWDIVRERLRNTLRRR
jgi:hypothetical protein